VDDDVELVDVDELVLDEVEELVVLEELEVEDEEVDEEVDEVLVGPADVVELPVGTAELEGADILQKALQGVSIAI
jgi:predicted transposase YdaD